MYFLGYKDPARIPLDPARRPAFLERLKVSIQLTHHWGTELDANFKGYHTGIDSGLLGIAVENVQESCARFDELGVEFAKRPDDGRIKGLALIKGPDGYMVQIFDESYMTSIVTASS